MTGYQYDQEATLVTNDKGFVNLGQLEFVEKMRAHISVKNRTLQREWMLQENDLEVGYL